MSDHPERSPHPPHSDTTDQRPDVEEAEPLPPPPQASFTLPRHADLAPLERPTSEALPGPGDFATLRTPAALLEEEALQTRPIRAGMRPLDDDPPEDNNPSDEKETTNEWRFDASLGEAGADGEDSHVIGGRYRILEGVAMGGMGAVFQVRHLTLGKVFALKIIHQALSTDSQMMKFFSREAQVLSKLDHPGIVQITDFGHDERFGAYLVMEYLTGETLHQRIARERRLALGPALQVGLQIAEALHHMHSAELIHCDIKPENIFLVKQPRGGRREVLAKIIDFGLSKSTAAGATLNESELGGTPMYAAPEQLEGQAPQPSMDIYSMGVLLYHLIAGATPFTGSTAEVCSRKLTQAAPPLSSHFDTPVDEHLEGFVMKALERRPEHRHGSMAQLVFELRTVMDMLGLGASRGARGRHPRNVPTIPEMRAPEPGAACDRCPAPVFFTDGEAHLTAVNSAFARLVNENAEALLGRPLSSTRLGNIYADIDDDLRTAIGTTTPLQRIVSYDRQGKQTTLLFWIVSQADDGPRLWGMVIPLDSKIL